MPVETPVQHENLLNLLKQVFNFGDDAQPIEQKLRMVEELRASNPRANSQIDRVALGLLETTHNGLTEAQANQQNLREVLEKLTQPPWHPATFRTSVQTLEGEKCVVSEGSEFHIVSRSEEVEGVELAAGDDVLLSTDRSLIMEKLAFGLPWVGETAHFERYMDDGRLVLSHRDEEYVVDPAVHLEMDVLENGDLVRWRQKDFLAFEKIDKPDSKRFLVEDLPDAHAGMVGGNHHNLRRILSALTSTLVSPELAAKYGISGRQSIMLVGPPGTGKTLMARVAATEVQRISGRKCRFAVVKPGEWENEYVGATQRNIRECFASLRDEMGDGYAVLFLDEIESIGRIRGSSFGNAHGDKFLAALLAEIDGFERNDRLAIICASNRKDLIDPALLERISAVEVVVGRPDQRGAREIFNIHLPEDLPFSPNGKMAGGTRRDLIDLAVSKLYSPNGDNELCTLKFRDGKTRRIAARELASGRAIEQICHEARKSAFQRELESNEPGGIDTTDMEEAVAATIESMTSTLTPRNVHAYLFDLPQDVDVVAVEPTARRASRPHRMLNSL